MTKAIVGIIGGSGVYDLPGLEDLREERVSTPWGEPSDALRFGRIGNTHRREHLRALGHRQHHLAGAVLGLEILELGDQNLAEYFARLSPEQLKELNTAVAKEKNSDRVLAILSSYITGADDLDKWFDKLEVRVDTARSYLGHLTKNMILKSRFYDETEGISIARLKKHISGLVSVSIDTPKPKAKAEARARYESPSPVPARRGLMGWF